MTIMCNVVSGKFGAGARVFDGAMKVNVHGDAKEALAAILGTSLSAYTTDEGGQGMFKLKSKSFNEMELLDKTGWHSGPATNHATYGRSLTLIPIDVPLAGGGSVEFNVAPTGAIQTGTLDATLGLAYIVGSVPGDIIAKYPMPVRAKDGMVECDTVTAIARQVLDGKGGAGNLGVMEIPKGFDEICGMTLGCFHDTAVTAAQNINGFVDLSANIDIGEQEWPLPPIYPGAGILASF